MATIIINVNMEKYVSHEQLVTDLSKGFAAKKSDYVYFNIDLNLNNAINGDFLVLLLMIIRHLKANRIKVKGQIMGFKQKSDAIQYANKVNFFRFTDIELPEKFVAREINGRFTEILNFNSPETLAIAHTTLRNLFDGNAKIPDSVKRMLDFTLKQVMDNVLEHAHSLTGGWCQAQLFVGRTEIRLIIGDTGIGIHESVTKSPKYSYLKPYESIVKCTAKGISGAEGSGTGLYYTTEFIKQNKGDLTIHSGAYAFKITKGVAKVIKTNHWQGTHLYMRVNLANEVDTQVILGDDVVPDFPVGN